jgi:ubiquitin carboxyl-terminal hydrolase 22/27/51
LNVLLVLIHHYRFLGLRGMNNLGNTCFMSVILQSFVHNPLLCTYFLSDKHNSAACRISKSGKRCLSCEMDYLFSSMFSGKKVPFSPHQFLFTTWKCSDHLAGYDQQDAHEFLISSLDKVHSHCEGTFSPHMLLAFVCDSILMLFFAPTEARKHAEANENKMDVDNQHFQGKCRCIIHGTFSGYLRSDVSCESCKATSTAIDPFFDISLDIPPSASADPNDMRDITLVDCLRKYAHDLLLDRPKF